MSELPTYADHLLSVTETFVDSVQGEGRTAGQLASFLRLTGCHRSCAWCDQPETWRVGEVVTRRENALSLAGYFAAGKARKLVITGGEPLLQQNREDFRELLWRLHLLDFTFEVETEGSIPPGPCWFTGSDPPRVWFNISPKLSGAQLPRRPAYPKLGRFPPDRMSFKFVVGSEEEAEEVGVFLDHWTVSGREGSASRVWLMPEGKTRAAQLEKMPLVARWALDRGYHFSPRLHILLWNDQRGV